MLDSGVRLQCYAIGTASVHRKHKTVWDIGQLQWSECVLPTFICCNPNPQGDRIWKRGFWDVVTHESRALMNGVNALTKWALKRACLPFLPREINNEKSATPKRVLTHHWHPDIRLPTRTVRNKCLLFTTHPGVMFCYSSPDGLKKYKCKIIIFLYYDRGSSECNENMSNWGGSHNPI